jgi:hypothetical protein
MYTHHLTQKCWMQSGLKKAKVIADLNAAKAEAKL